MYISIISNQIVQFIIRNFTEVIPYSSTRRLKVHLETSSISGIAFQVKKDLNTATRGSDDPNWRLKSWQITLKRFSNGAICCLLSQLVTFKYCNLFKLPLIRSLYVIVSSSVIFCNSSSYLLSQFFKEYTRWSSKRSFVWYKHWSKYIYTEIPLS